MKESHEPVKLKEFHTHLYQRMNEFRQRNRLCDVNIDVNGKSFPCHRIILTATSPFFETLLDENSEQDSKTTSIVVKGVEHVALDEILNAIYSAQLHLLPENVYFILRASHVMQLEIIKTACIAWIMKNTNIHYLIDVCLFAKTIDEEKLYQKCVDTISSDVINWSRTDAFKDIPFDVLNYILSKCDTSKNEEMVLLMIIKWSKYNKVKSANVQTLLDSAKLKGKIVSTPIMSELITNADDDVFSMEESKTTGEEIESCSLFNFNLYVNAVDVKTGVRGWGLMKINDAFDECVMSTFHATSTNSLYRKVVKIGTKVYCLDYNQNEDNVFYCYDECHNEIELDLPEDDVFPMFDFMATDNTIYLLRKGGVEDIEDDESIWMYDRESDAWVKSFEQKHKNQREKGRVPCGNVYSGRTYCSECRRGHYCKVEYETYDQVKPSLYGYEKNSHAFASSDGNLYVIAQNKSSKKVILAFDHDSSTPSELTTIDFSHQNAAVCAFDNKIAISGSSDDNVLGNTFDIFDIAAKKWLPDIKPMNYGRANHTLFHYDGFLYAVENGRPLVPNEKYDIKSNEWINIPALPKRILVENTNDVMVVSTADVLGVDVNSTQ